MNQFTTEIIQTLVKGGDISEIFRQHLESAVNTLLQTELTAFLDYEKYDRVGFNSGNSRNGSYKRTLHTEYGDLSLVIPRDRNGEFNQQTVAPYKCSNDTPLIFCDTFISKRCNHARNIRFNLQKCMVITIPHKPFLT